MVYITGHTFTNRLSNRITAKVYANCDSVTLFLNGNSKGAVDRPIASSPGRSPYPAGPISLRPLDKDGVSVHDSLEWIAPSAKATANAAGALQDPNTNTNTALSAVSTKGLTRKD